MPRNFTRPKPVYAGKNKIREYRIWKLMLARCTNPDNPNWDRYGGRGIRVCERWHSFDLFLADMGAAPTDKHTLDRFPNGDGNYEPGNCRWATRKEQSRNTSTNRFVEFNGESLCIAEWAERVGLSRHTIEKRLRNGWPIEVALTAPVMPSFGRGTGDVVFTTVEARRRLALRKYNQSGKLRQAYDGHTACADDADDTTRTLHKPRVGGSIPPAGNVDRSET